MKAVLVANADGKRLYYIVDSETRTNDGVLASSVNDAELVDFWPTVKAANSLIPITNTDFHKFLWSEGKGLDSGYWHSCFIAKRFSVKEELLDSVVVRTDIFNNRIKFNELTNRAMDFKSSMFSPSKKGILKRLGSRLSGNLNQATGGVRGFKLGEVFDPKAIDADADGFVQEGTQFARVATPSVSADLPEEKPMESDSSSESQKKNSIRTRVAAKFKATITGFDFFEPGSGGDSSTRWVDRSARVLDNEFDLQEKNIVDKFNNGNKIATVGDAKKVLSQLASKGTVDFLQNKPDDELLSPYESELFLGFAHGLFVAPHLRDIKINFTEIPTKYEVDANGRQKIVREEQGSQQLLTGIFVGQGDRFLFPSRSSGRKTMEHEHNIAYMAADAGLTQIRSGRVNPRSGRWQEGSFEKAGYDIVSLKIAAAYLFDDASDPDYKKFISLSKKITEKMQKGQTEEQAVKSLSEQLQDEYALLNSIFAKKLEEESRNNPVQIESILEKAQLRMMRSVMVHELGHAAHQERAFQDAINAAKNLRDRHIGEFGALNSRLAEINDALNSSNLDKSIQDDLLVEAATISEKIKGSIMTSPQDLAALATMQDQELLPFYTHHLLHGEGDKLKEAKIAQDIMDRNAARVVTDLLAAHHGSFAGDDLSANSWLDNALLIMDSRVQKELVTARIVGDQRAERNALMAIDAFKDLSEQIKIRGIERLSDPVLDKNGNKIKLTVQMSNTLQKLRSKTASSQGMDIYLRSEMGVENTKPGEDMRMKDLLDFVALGIYHINQGIVDSKIDPDVGIPGGRQEVQLTGDPHSTSSWIPKTSELLGNSFAPLSDIASAETRAVMTDAVRRLGLLHFDKSQNSLSKLNDTNARIREALDTLDLSDDQFGKQITDPLDLPDGAKNLIDSMIANEVNAVRETYKKESSDGQSFWLGATLALAAVHRYTYDNLTKEERQVAETIAKFGSGTPFAAYMSLIVNQPFSSLMRREWGENRVELFSELAMLNAYRMTVYSGAKDASGKVFSRLLNKQEIEVLKKLLSWYQPNAEFHLGSTPLEGGR